MPGGGTLCIVANCKSNSKRAKQGDQLIRFFSFPNNPSQEEEWVKACQQKKKFDPKVKKICSLHFKKGDFEDELKAQIMNYAPKKLKKGAIPSINLPSAMLHASTTTTELVQTTPVKAKRNTAKIRTELVEECLKQYDEVQIKSTSNKEACYLKTKEILPGSSNKRRKCPAKFKKQLDEDFQVQPKENGSTADVPSNAHARVRGSSKKRKKSPVKFKKQLIELSSDDENVSDIQNKETVRTSPQKKIRMDLRKRIEKEVVSYMNTDIVFAYEAKLCSNRSCQRQLKALDEEIDSLKKVIISNEQIKTDLEHKLNALQKKLDSSLEESFEEKAKELFKDFLSANQIHVALKKKTKPWWTKEDMSKAFSILYFSKRCYLHLRNNLNYPLPGLSTLRKWTSGMDKSSPLDDNPIDQSIGFEKDQQGRKVECKSTEQLVGSTNQPPEENSSEGDVHLDGDFTQCDSPDPSVDSENLPSSNTTGDSLIDKTQHEGNSGETLNENLKNKQTPSQTTENVISNSGSHPSDGKVTKNEKFKRRRPLIASKKFEFQSYLKNYLSKKNLVTASSSSKKEKPFTCSICRQGFDKNIALQRHYKMHASEDPWKCDVCEDVFVSKYYLEKHILTHKDDNNKFVCDICNRSFIQKNSFKDHYLLHRNLKPLEPCKESIDQSTAVCSNAPVPETPPSKINTSTQHASPKDKPYSCHVCNESFDNKNNLKSHLPVHGEKVKKVFRKRYTCTKCNKEFKFRLCHEKHLQICGVDPSTLKNLPIVKRVKKVFDKIYTCPTCSKVFKFHHSFEKHLQTCTEKKVFTCEVCDKTFNHPWSARRHMLLHDQQTWFYCEICNKSFKQRYYLKQHMIVHSGEKPFACKWCDKRFAQNSTLKKHIEAHKSGNYSKSTANSKKNKVEMPSTSYNNTNYPLNPNVIRNPMEMPSCASFPNTNYPLDPNLKRNPMEMPSSSYYFLTQL